MIMHCGKQIQGIRCDSVPGELWMEVCNIVQEALIKTTPKKKKCKRAKWLSEEALQIAEKRSEAKGKAEKERYTQVNAEFQEQQEEIKKKKLAFLSEQCKEIEENNRMGKTRDLFKKIRGDISCKDGHNKEQEECGPNRSRRY